jgi:multiple sugar transport system substrate-binding protein
VNPEIEFSVMRSSATGIRALLDQFEAEQHMHVRLRLLDWDSAWSDLIKVALYGDGPDISEIGSTWLGDLVAMNAIRAFDDAEISALGKASAFLPSAWQSVRLIGQPEVWAIPWVAGARLLFFRRNLLQGAGVDEQTAFRGAEEFDQTLNRLQARGVAVPWTVPTGLTHTTLHNAASWVWGAGGDFVSADGKRTLFGEPETCAGLRAYFALGRYLAPSVRGLNALEPDAQFLQNEDTALTMSGAWLFGQASSELRVRMGIGLPPGPSFVGGSHLVIWKHTPKHQAALELIRFLTRPQAQIAHSQNIGLLPARLDALAAAPFSANPVWSSAIVGLKTGRSFPATRHWGLMEDRLTTALGKLWAEALADPDLDLDRAIAKRLEPLAKRLDLVLGQT